MIKFNYDHIEKITTFSFEGRMDTIAVEKVNADIKTQSELNPFRIGERLVFDMKNVDYVASSFIRICVQHAKLAGTEAFSMINCQPFIKKTFKISGLDEFLNIQ